MKRSRDIRWAEVKVGLLLVVSLSLLALGIFVVGEKTRLFTPTTEINVLLPNVQGLQVGAPVWLSGVVIGTVSEITFTRPQRSDQVTVTLAIDEAASSRLGPDSLITVKTRGLVGEKYVDITPGSLYGLIPGMPLQGVPPVGLDEAILKAYSAFDRFDRMVSAFEASDGSLGRFVRDPALYDNTVELAERMQKVLGAMTEGEGSLAQIIRDPHLYRQALTFTGKGTEAVTELQALVRSLQDPDGSLGKLVRDPALYDESLETVRRFQSSLSEFDRLLTAIRDGEGTTGKLIGEPELHDKLTSTLEDLDALLLDMKKNPGRYLKFSLF